MVIAELELDVADSDQKLRARLWMPEHRAESGSWVCRFDVSAPLETSLEIHGTSSLQSVALALKGLSATLYASDLYRTGKLGAWGEFGGYLGLPAPSTYQDFAPFPF